MGDRTTQAGTSASKDGIAVSLSTHGPHARPSVARESRPWWSFARVPPAWSGALTSGESHLARMIHIISVSGLGVSSRPNWCKVSDHSMTKWGISSRVAAMDLHLSTRRPLAGFPADPGNPGRCVAPFRCVRRRARGYCAPCGRWGASRSRRCGNSASPVPCKVPPPGCGVPPIPRSACRPPRGHA